VEFSDKRVREVDDAAAGHRGGGGGVPLEELTPTFVEKKFSKMPYTKTLDDIFGVVYAQDLLHIADQDLPRRKVRRAGAGRCFLFQKRESGIRPAAPR